jgi:hypothetical protein
MLQILIWAVCVLIIAVGYVGWKVEESLAYQKQAKKTSGASWFALMCILAAAFAVMAYLQGKGIAEIVR